MTKIVEICDFGRNLAHIAIGVGIFVCRDRPRLRRRSWLTYYNGGLLSEYTEHFRKFPKTGVISTRNRRNLRFSGKFGPYRYRDWYILTSDHPSLRLGGR